MGRFEGRVALITGAARGMGRSHAVRLASEGADIIAVDICHDIPLNPYDLATSADLRETSRMVEERGSRVFTAEVDVRDFTSLRAAVSEGVAKLGRLDVVVANAGIAPMGVNPSEHEHEDPDGEIFDLAIGVNLVGTWNTYRAAIDHIRAGQRGGAIILISSTSGLKGYAGTDPGAMGYTASKSAILGLMRSLANSAAPESIRVNAILPAGISTRMSTNPNTQRWVTTIASTGIPLQNALPVTHLDPEDISDSVAFLASDEAKYITGVALPVDAGFCNR